MYKKYIPLSFKPGLSINIACSAIMESSFSGASHSSTCSLESVSILSYNMLTIIFVFPALDFSTISKLMGLKWHQLSDKDKVYWQNMQRKQVIKHKNIPTLSAKKISSRRGSGHSGTYVESYVTLSKNVVSAFQISCEVLSFTSEDS